MTFKVTAYEHVGIRVSQRERSIQFYEVLGWKEEIDLPEHHANEMVNESGVYINLIFNGISDQHAKNILQDHSIKYPGMTHAAFVVDDIDALINTLKQENIPITDGPHIYSNRRKLIFIRDPDGNVLEFNEILK
ncbi:VOC family protein [Psychrobacter sp. CAL346-MNA-CIBAN-0220]|uniref:VOC family protein n=1 Tax=Psychrobacter sp. CAL346-MNA-CIBAN-0220 TaxID=3140457 RepID=UPI003322DB7A